MYQNLIDKFFEFLMYREEKYRPKHTVCAMAGFWIHTPTKRKGIYLIKYLNIYWGMFPYLSAVATLLLGNDQLVLTPRVKISVPVRRMCLDERLEEIQSLFDNSESRIILENPCFSSQASLS